MDKEEVKEAEQAVAVWDVWLTVILMAAGMLGGSTVMLACALCAARQAFFGFSEDEGRKGILSVFLLNLLFVITGMALIVVNVRQLITGSFQFGPRPGLLILLICAGSVLLKRMMGRHFLVLFLESKAGVFLGDAWSQKMDERMFLLSLVGLCAAMLGLLWAEPLTGILVCLYFLKCVFVL